MKRFFVRRFFAGLLLLTLAAGAGCTKGPDQDTVSASQPKRLTIWSVLDDRDPYSGIIQAYQEAHPHISITYKRFRLEEYQEMLLNAFAEDRGPDIFLIHNTWVGKYLPKIEPMPAFTKMVYTIVEGGYTNRTETLVLQNEKSITLREVRDLYPDVVAKDVIRKVDTAAAGEAPFIEEKVVGLPVSVDTLAMFVNKDMLNAAGIPTIPTEWGAFQATMNRLVQIDADGQIVQAGAAMGTSANIERPGDILSVLMLQNGTQMASDDGYPSFALMPEALSQSRDELPAVQALRFYTDFTNEEKSVYSWNAAMLNDFDAFVQGRLAYFFGYSYHLPLIQARAPKLNLTIAKLPQIEGGQIANFANYWLWTVSDKSKETETAWNFINYLSKPENEQKYLDSARRPPAHRSLIESYLDDERLGVFTSQILTSQSWYRGVDPDTAEKALKELIDAAPVTEEKDWPKLLSVTQDKVYQTIRAKKNP